MKEFIVNNMNWLIPAVWFIISTTFEIILTIKGKIKKSKIDILKKNISQLIIDAENFKNYSGDEKKQYVMTRAIQIAHNLMSETEIDNYVEEQVSLTNSVNVKKGR